MDGSPPAPPPLYRQELDSFPGVHMSMSARSRHALPVWGLVASLCAAATTCEAQEALLSPTASANAQRFVPLVDIHQHLASPADTRLLNRSLPAIRVPDDIGRLLARLQQHWNEPTVLAQNYTEDAVALGNFQEPAIGWKEGREAVARYMGTLFGRPFDMVPVLLRERRGEARVAGYLSRGAGEAARHFGYFELELQREGDGAWQIASDSRVFQPRPEFQEVVDGRDLVAKLDAAGIRYAVVLSEAHWFDSGYLRLPGASRDEIRRQVRAENDWTAEQAAASGGRLIAFCSLNPLSDDAIEELRRCASSHRFAGLKLHLQMSDVDLLRDEHVQAVSSVFAEANRLRLPILVHAQTRGPYGAPAARAFTERVLAAAPDIPVTIAHLWGGGPFNADALAVFVAFANSDQPGARHLSFDVAEAALVANGQAEIDRTIAQAIRSIGVRRLYFGSDAIGPDTLSPVQATAQFRKDIPLTDDEFAVIASNRPPYLPK
jgi:predicted TIM-barrel fold metal-dependent hydrolase